MRQENWTEICAKRLCVSFLRDETAQDLVEYVLIAALIGAGVVLTWEHILGSMLATAYYLIASQIGALVGG